MSIPPPLPSPASPSSPGATRSSPGKDQSSNPQPHAKQSLESYPIRSNAPIPLTACQEAEVRDLYYKNVRAKCADEIKAFAHCATSRTFTIPLYCRAERRAMETCMNNYAGREEEDRAREEWFATVGERRREKAKEESWKEEQRQRKRDWWRDYEVGKGGGSGGKG